MLAVVIGVQVFLALPLPREVGTAKSPESRAEVQRWLALGERIGVHMTPDEMQASLHSLGAWTGGFRRELVQPWLPVQRWMGTGQGWAFFAVPDTHPVRLEVTVVEPEGSRVVFRRLDPAHRWRASTFAYRRVRGLYDSARKKNTMYRRFSRWVAREALADHPEGQAVELQVLKNRVTLPGEPRDEATVRRLYLRFDREDL